MDTDTNLCDVKITKNCLYVFFLKKFEPMHVLR